MRLLAYKILVDRFNDKYKSLDSAQKKLLKEYINNVSNTNQLKEYLDLESSKVKKVLKSLIQSIKDKVT